LYKSPHLELCLSGIVDGLRSPAGFLKHQFKNSENTDPLPHADHQQALGSVVTLLQSRFARLNLTAIGHRVVHGGEHFREPPLIDESVVGQIETLSVLAPLHNPAHALGIRAMRQLFPNVPQVAVFDTAFHQTMPAKAFRYAIPENLYRDHGVRRYGAHGTSHEFVANGAAEIFGRPLAELQLITVHLGNGCSACAIRNGRSVDTTMGLTPQEGMMMGTRSGDVDLMLLHFLVTRTGKSLEAITHLLTRESGLLGVSGSTNDCRELEERMNEGDDLARFALDLFCYRAAKSILGMTAALSKLDAMVFTGGIGENSSFARRNILEHLAVLGPELNIEANELNGRATGGRISGSNGPAVLVVNTDEELAIARQTACLVSRK